MSEQKKYLAIGSLVENEDRNGNAYEQISLDNTNLKEFVEYLTGFGKKYLAGKTDDEIKAAMKSKDIPRIYLSFYDPSDKAPDFIKKNVVLKLTEL